MQTPVDRTTAPAPPRVESRGASAPGRDSLQEALTCLETSGRKLKRARPEQTDEVLNLLRAATAHLRQALDSGRGGQTERALSGAE